MNKLKWKERKFGENSLSYNLMIGDDELEVKQSNSIFFTWISLLNGEIVLPLEYAMPEYAQDALYLFYQENHSKEKEWKNQKI